MTKSVAKKKLIITVAALAVTTGFFAYGTRAYFTDKVTSGKNVISVVGVNDVQLVDLSYAQGGLLLPPDQPVPVMPGQSVGKTVSVKNTGESPIFVRIKLTPIIILSEKEAGRESEIDLSLVRFEIDETKWLYQDGYYHYYLPLEGGEETENLIPAVTFSPEMGNMYKDSLILVTTRMEVVQANYNASFVLDATGWATPTEGGTP